MYAGTSTCSLRDHAIPTQQSARHQKIEIPIKKNSNCHICFACPVGYFWPFSQLPRFFIFAFCFFATVPKQNKYAGTRQHAKLICKHTVARKTNMPSPGATQNKYGSTKKQTCGHPAARKRNMHACNGVQNKYAMTCWHAKQICQHPAARKTNMQAHAGTQN